MTARDIVFVVIIPLILAEVGPWCGWLAARLLPWAARLCYGDTDRAAVRLAEWSGDLDEIPGQLTKLAYAAGYLVAGSVASARQKIKKEHGRRLIDSVAAATALLFLAPLFATIAIMIRFRDHGPVLFKQTGVGKNGRTFTVYKFRTMVVDAGERKAKLAAHNEFDAVLFKIRADPRITKTGSWLRRYSLDELPQLFNVLRGDMSLIGPRLPLPEEAAVYGDCVCRRLAVKPGLTGLWQVNDRSDLSSEESIRLDLRYMENWSLALDLQILWKTWSAVFRRDRPPEIPPSAPDATADE